MSLNSKTTRERHNFLTLTMEIKIYKVPCIRILEIDSSRTPFVDRAIQEYHGRFTAAIAVSEYLFRRSTRFAGEFLGFF